MPPLRVAVVNEAVHGHRAIQVRLERLFAERPDVEATFDAIPAPNRLERLMLRRFELARSSQRVRAFASKTR